MKTIKRFGCMVSAVILSLSLFSIPAMASESGNKAVLSGSVEISKQDSSKVDADSVLKTDGVDEDKLGSITIQLEETENKAPRKDVKLAVVRVADVIDGEFVLVDSYKKSDVDLNKIVNANELELAASKLVETIKGEADKKADLNKLADKGITIITNDDGKAIVKDLEVGVYLVYAIDNAKYDLITPFLISIPTWSEKDADMLYDIIAYPKHTKPVVKPSGGAPGTGIENNAVKYLSISGALLVSAGLVYVVSGIRKKENS